MTTKLVKGSFYAIVAVLTGILAFFIIYNAGWIVGDDAIVIRHTGWRHFFNPADTVVPYAGRFYPLAYVIYNILPIFQLYSANAHFALHTLVFILFSVVSFWAAYKAIDAKQLAWQDYVLVLSAGLVCIARAYCSFLDAYSTIWEDYVLILIWALCSCYVHKCQSLTAMIIGLLSVTYLTFCMETNFVFPLSYGILGLIFTCKKSSKLEKTYMWSLIGVGMLFLFLYFFICFLHIEDAYDGSHGHNITIFSNAIKMFIAQKVLWIVLILVCWRMYCIFVRKEEFEFWDIFLLTGCANCCGCAVMKLDWTLYYSLASLLTIPAIVYYLNKYVGSKWAWFIMFGLALFTFRKVPEYIKNNQKGRKSIATTIEILERNYKRGENIYWFAPEAKGDWSFDVEQRTWLHSCLQTQFGRQMDNEYLNIPIVKTFEGQRGIYVLPIENNRIFPESNNFIISAGVVLQYDDVRNFTIVKIQ